MWSQRLAGEFTGRSSGWSRAFQAAENLTCSRHGLQPERLGVGRRGFMATCELTCTVGWCFCGGRPKGEENDMASGNCLMV